VILKTSCPVLSYNKLSAKLKFCVALSDDKLLKLSRIRAMQFNIFYIRKHIRL